MASGDGNFDGALGLFLAPYLGEILIVVPEGGAQLAHVDPVGEQDKFAGQEIGGFAQIADGVDLQVADDGGLVGVLHGNKKPSESLGGDLHGDGQGALDAADGPA